MKRKHLVRLLRPRQWLKNCLVFAPLVFARKADDPGLWGFALLAFLSFCAAASAVYIFNDYRDRREDRLHPDKKDRPLASGAVPATTALGLAAVLVLVSLLLCVLVRPGLVLFPLLYLVVNVAYTLRLKHVVILDALCIAMGFLLRIVAGGEAIGVPCSSWLILCTLFVSLLLAFLKRRGELKKLDETAGLHRKTLLDYNPGFLDRLTGPLAAMTVMAYSLYTVDQKTMAKLDGSRDLLLTVPLVIFGVFRYLYLADRGNRSDDPTGTLTRDLPIILAGLLWLALSALVVYGYGPGL